MDLNAYTQAVQKLNEMSYNYYTLDNPIATDYEYDMLYHEVKAYEKENGYIDPFSPTMRIGDIKLENFESSKHILKMYSLDDIFENTDLNKFNTDVISSEKNVEFYCGPKYDGASLNLLYENGALVKGSTRGNGEEGENITGNIPHILGVPLNISFKGKLEIRGEVVIFKKDFILINKKRYDNGETLLKNERNAASGGLRSLESNSVKDRKLRFVPYGIGYSDKIFEKESEIFKFIISLGFTDWDTNTGNNIFNNIDDVEKFYLNLVNTRDDFPMLLDGMVVKINSIPSQLELGFTNKYPKWAVAYKFPAVERTTYIKNIINQVGKTGVITPVAIVEPVDIDGVVVERATLHNYEEIARKDIKIGDKIAIIRSGDVIPKILYSFTNARTGNETDICEPTVCPECGSAVIKDKKANSEEDKANIKCSNKKCLAILKASIIYSVGKKALDIDGFGDSTVEQLVNNGRIQDLRDIYSLSVDDLLSLDKFAIKKAEKLLKAIGLSKKCDLYRFINSLNIENIGETASKAIVNALGYKSISKTITLDELKSVNDVGEIMAKAYVEFFNDHFDNYILPLVETIEPFYEEKVKKSNIFDKMTFVITGTLSQSRDHFKAIIEDNGGKVSGSGSSKTSYVLVGEEAGTKKDKAIELNVKIINEDEFNNMIDI